mgnify:CR=1 FL=1
MTFSSLFTGSLLAGILIALGDMMYVCIENKIIAAFLFSIALCFIRIRKLNLFTGSIGKLYFDKNLKIYHLLFILLFNIVGTAMMRLVPDFPVDVYAIAETKFLNASLWRVGFYSIFCGMLMVVATDSQTPMWLTIMCVAGFLLAGFRHSIADSWYFWHLPLQNYGVGLKVLGVEILGNFIGGSFIALFIKENLQDKTKHLLNTKNL